MPKISVLVAVYNTAEYLPECLDSLLSQTLDDIQIICVDDCSTDSSLSILQNYARSDHRVEVYHLERNSGQDVARNFGLSHVSGEYVAFLDSDDWLSLDALQSVADAFERNPQLDCVLLNLVMSYRSGGECRDEHFDMPQFESMSGSEAFEKSLDWTIHGVYVGRTSLFKNLKFDTTTLLYGDENTTHMHYLDSREVGCCSGTYYYRQNPESTTRKLSTRRFMVMKSNEAMKAFMVERGIDRRVMSEYEKIRWLNIVDCCKLYYQHSSELSEADQRFALAEIRSAWQGIDRQLLDRRLRRKFGYVPFNNWHIFWLEEQLYFLLKRIVGKL